MAKPVTRSRIDLGFTMLSWLLVLLFVAAGVVKLIPIEFERANFIHFGYAPWFMAFIGFVEIAGGLLLAVRQTRVPGALLLASTMAGAVGSHLRAGDGVAMATPAFVLLLLLVAVTVRFGMEAREPLVWRGASRSA